MRFTKQIIFGIIFLVVVGLIVWGIYGIFLKPAPSCFNGIQDQGETGIDCGGSCIPCEIKSLKPIEIHWTKAFRATDTTSGVVSEVYNPNPQWAAQDFSYTINLKDQFGKVIQSISGDSFLYGGELKYIVEPSLDITVDKIASAELVVVGAPQWVSISSYPRPDVEVQNVQTGKDISLYVIGKAVNRSEVDFSQAVVDALVYNNNGDFIAASKTIVDNLPKFGSKNFRVSFANDLSIYQPQESPFAFLRTLKVGDSGNDVTQLQLFLAESGFLNRDPTGYFDSITSQAMVQMQTKGGIPATGELDELTRQVLNAGFAANIATSTPLQNSKSVDPSRTKVLVEVKR